VRQLPPRPLRVLPRHQLHNEFGGLNSPDFQGVVRPLASLFQVSQRAFIFEMDGTTVDNMHFHTEAWMETIGELGADPVDPHEWEQRTSGVPNRTIFAEMLGVPTEQIADWVEWKEAAYRRLSIGKIEPIRGFVKFLNEARNDGVRLGMATGAGPENIRFNLAAMELESAFSVIVGANDVVNGKPDPEVFLTTAAKLGVPPSGCVVFEDAPLGIEAARRAGMQIVALTTMLHAAELSALPGVGVVIDDYTQIDLSPL
jgi:HAD superfamily hydrolase (TIGR01509 family)